MHPLHPDRHSLRAFLARAGQLALAGTAAPLALNLAALGEAAAFDASDEAVDPDGLTLAVRLSQRALMGTRASTRGRARRG